MPAKVIFLEGPNYCGKSTIIKALAKIFEKENKSFYTTIEPGGDALGMEIRRLLLDKDTCANYEMDYTCRRLLYAASHAQMLKDLRKKIEEYDYIFVDRYNPMSDLVYGVMSEDDPAERIKKIQKSRNIFHTFDNEFLKEISTLIFLDISIETMEQRDKMRGTTENKIYDYEGWNFKLAIHSRYKYLSDNLMKEDCPYNEFVPFNRILTVDTNDAYAAERIYNLLQEEIRE
jgi:thymidylate kinase